MSDSVMHYEDRHNEFSYYDGVQYPKGSGFGGRFRRLPDNIYSSLRTPIDPKAISKHPTKSYLSTIKAIYVTERLNNVFGIGGWNLEHEVVERLKNNDKDFVVMKGRIYMKDFDLYTPFQYGGHELDGKGTDASDGYKSAVTDIQSKCASMLEIGIAVFKGLGAVPVVSAPVVKEEAQAMPKKKHITAPKEKPKPSQPEESIPEEEDEQIIIYDKYVKKAEAYTDSAEFHKDSKVLVKDAIDEGLSDELVEKLKNAMRQHYSKLQ